jgi:hypothetical protein
VTQTGTPYLSARCCWTCKGSGCWKKSLQFRLEQSIVKYISTKLRYIHVWENSEHISWPYYMSVNRTLFIWTYLTNSENNYILLSVWTLSQWFSTLFRPRPIKFFFSIRRGPGIIDAWARYRAVARRLRNTGTSNVEVSFFFSTEHLW